MECDMAISFPVSNISTLNLAQWLEVVDYMHANGDVPQVKHFAEQLGIDPQDPDAKPKLAQLLLRVAALLDAGALVGSLDEA